MDYGHDLRFGVFLTPSAAARDEVLGLVRLAEDAGLDLVAFQDHPYQPRFLDTWTLLSYVAARTERVVLAPDVANLPLRQPAVLARAAASLDLLSGGRVALGLGAGAFWDAIEAMGGPRLTPGQAVQALAEAIAVVRGIWDVDRTGPLVVDGEFHHLRGAKRGPRPAHPIDLWLGAGRPRMLALVGTTADGWLPTLERAGVAGIAAGNAAIDDAARAAGRDPRAIRRLLNVTGELDVPGGRGPMANGGPGEPTGRLHGPARQWADRLADLTMSHGISTFILASDDATTIESYARDIAPAVRDLVATGREGS